MIPYQDLHQMPEDTRIAYMAEMAVAKGGIIGVLVDDDPFKVKRYKDKLLATGKVTILGTYPGPVKDVVLIKITRHESKAGLTQTIGNN